MRLRTWATSLALAALLAWWGFSLTAQHEPSKERQALPAPDLQRTDRRRSDPAGYDAAVGHPAAREPLDGGARSSAARQPVLHPAPGRALDDEPIGSEGYGPHIQAAVASSSAESARQALEWLDRCLPGVNESALRVMAQARPSMQPLGQEALTAVMKQVQTISQRCQTVTEEERALVPKLALTAMRGGVPGAAARVQSWLNRHDDPAFAPVREELLAGLRRDALAGDQHAQWALAYPLPGRGLEVDPVEQRAWGLVLESRGETSSMRQHASAIGLMELLTTARPLGLTETEEAQARELAAQWAAAAASAAAPGKP